MAMRRRSRRRPIEFPEISLTPLIDTAFTLLIIFMITAPMMRMTIKVDLPDSQTSQTTKVEEENLTVEMDTHGRIHFNNNLYDMNVRTGKNSREALKNAVAAKVTKTNNNVFLFADKSLRYEQVIKLFDVLNPIEGVQHVALVTQKVV